MKTEDGDWVILLNVSFTQLKLNTKEDITKSFPVSDSSHKTEEERDEMTPLTVARWRGRNWPTRRPTCRQAITAAKIPARSSGRVLRVRKPKMEEPAPAPTPKRKTASFCYTFTKYAHADTERALGIISWHARVSPATSRLHSNSHSEYPIKYMKLPENK